MKPSNHEKRRVLFVGSFKTAPDGTMGGQLFACTTLVNSPLSEEVSWSFVDSTQRSLPPPAIWIRLLFAVKRIALCFWRLAFHRIDSVLVFSPFVNSSLLEKGLICFLGSLFKKNVVFTIRSEIVPAGQLGLGMRSIVRFIFSQCDCIIFQSKEAVEAANLYYGSTGQSHTVIKNWVSIPSSESRYNPTNRFAILFIGWLAENKRVSDLIRAIKILSERGSDVSLIVCGEGDQKDELARLSGELGIANRIDFRGWVSGEDKESAFESARALALVSLSEGLPNCVLEGMARGLPIVATPVGGIPSLIENDVNGFLVPPSSPAAIAEAIATLFDQPELCQAMAATNSAAVREHHNLDRAWPKLAEILKLDLSTLPSMR